MLLFAKMDPPYSDARKRELSRVLNPFTQGLSHLVHMARFLPASTKTCFDLIEFCDTLCQSKGNISCINRATTIKVWVVNILLCGVQNCLFPFSEDKKLKTRP